MSNTRLLVLIAIAVTLALAAVLWKWSGERAADQQLATEKATIQLYFPAEQGWIGDEPREVDLPQDDDGRARRVVAELLAGPTLDTHYPLLPAGTQVDAAFVEDDGTCVVELVSEISADPPQMGSRQEAELFASLLTSLSANVESVSKVVVLWNGRQPESFGGHFDTTRPLALKQTETVASPGVGGR